MFGFRALHDVSKMYSESDRMSYVFMELDHRHHDALIQLAHLTTTGSERFRVERSPHFFALPVSMGNYFYYGLFNREALIGCLGVVEQKRRVSGKVEKVHYLFDLRIHPDFQGSMAFYCLMRKWLQHAREKKKIQWVFSTILDENTKMKKWIEGQSRFTKAKKLGRTIHIGIPLFLPILRRPKELLSVTEISPDEAWILYQRFVGDRSLAPMDENLFKGGNGTYLCVKGEGEPQAVCKLVDQSGERRLLSTQTDPVTFKLLNIFCRIKGCPCLPKKNQMLHHGYLSYFAAESKGRTDYRNGLISYISAKYAEKFTYLFMGLPEKEASLYKGLFHVQLSSTTYGFGEVPDNLSLDFHELTLI